MMDTLVKLISFLFILVPSILNASPVSTIYDLEITSGSRGYYDSYDLSFIGTTDVFGTLKISVSSDGQIIKYLDQNITFVVRGVGYPEDGYQNGKCAWQSTLDCKTLNYRAASSDYYYSFNTPGYETDKVWSESIVFDGTSFTSNALRNAGFDSPFFFEYNATITNSIVTPIPAAFWLFSSGLFFLAKRRKR